MDKLEVVKRAMAKGIVTDEDGKWLISEIERLRKDLKCYGRHGNLCKIIQGKECDCGFERALKEE